MWYMRTEDKALSEKEKLQLKVRYNCVLLVQTFC